MPVPGGHYFPLILFTTGFVLVAVGVGITMNLEGISIVGPRRQRNTQLISFLVGVGMAAAGVIWAINIGGSGPTTLPVTSQSIASGAPEPEPTPEPAITLESPRSADRVTVQCPRPQMCTITASGLMDKAGRTLYAYLLVAHYHGTAARADFYVQYRSTSTFEIDWMGAAYLDRPAVGDRIVVKTILTEREITAASARPSPLKWVDAMGTRFGLAATSEVVQVTIGKVARGD